MLAVLRRRDFALLWLGQLISLTGDWVLFITLPFYVYQLTGSALATGAMFVVQILPRALFGSLAGVFVDRWSRKWTMIASDLSRAGLLLFLLFFHSRDQVWLVYVIGTLETSISLFFTPARSAIVP
ncbi:MAG: MFS transporter, partial [Ktedonobacteraceae bacterium]|nr:MFS transporter [Ktedonobacteraceae bacterium]